MILNRLTLVNFGVYRGQHTFDLRPRDGGPVVILGGKNGAGKTTVLEAIRLGLHGPLALDGHTYRAAKRSDYHQYLRERIHRPSDGASLDQARVELEFEYAVAGERYTYTVEREWKDDGQGVEETLHVRQDPPPSGDMDAAQWADLLRGLIPPGLTQIFFFDGESLHTLGNGSRDVQQIALSRAVKSLLGLHLVEQLQADLGVYRRRQQRGRSIDGARQRVERLEDELAQLKAEEDDLVARWEAEGRQVREVEGKIELQEAEIARAGGSFARQRETTKAAQVRLKVEIAGVEQAIRDLCAGLLPFAITPAYTAAVREQLLREAEYQRWLASRSFIEQKLDDIQAEIASPEFWQGTGAEALAALQQTMGERVVEALQRMVEPPEAMDHVEVRHHASEPERRQLLGWIEESQTTVPEQLETLTTQLIQWRAEMEDAERALQRVPPDEVLGPLVETLNAYHQELGGLAQAQRQTEEALHRLRLRREELNRDLRRAREEQEAGRELADKVRQVVDVQLVLDDFAERLAQLRVSQLEDAFLCHFNQLCRKERLLEGVEIDVHDFSVILVGAGGDVIPQTELSAGEREIYAIALLWALRQVSGRPLPVLIDASLGRLDSDHRRNLVTHYFPGASHQVILCSTDTEVDAEFFAALQPHISHAYHLAYDEAQRATRVSRGYFWTSDGGQAE